MVRRLVMLCGGLFIVQGIAYGQLGQEQETASRQVSQADLIALELKMQQKLLCNYYNPVSQKKGSLSILKIFPFNICST